jgi:hypothetical protein
MTKKTDFFLDMDSRAGIIGVADTGLWVIPPQLLLVLGRLRWLGPVRSMIHFVDIFQSYRVKDMIPQCDSL